MKADDPAGRFQALRKPALLALCGLAAVFLAAKIVTTALSERAYLDGDRVAALKWDADASAPLSRAAQAQFVNGDGLAAETLAKSAIERNPLDVVAFRTLALTAQKQGDAARAEELMHHANALSRRDAPTQLWLLAIKIQNGRLAEGLEHADAALRLQEGLGPTLFDVMSQAAADPRGVTTLARLLEKRPPWRWQFVTQMGSVGDPQATSNLLLAMRATSLPPANEETNVFLTRLSDMGMADQAYLLWLQLMPEANLAAAQNVFDGAFSGLSAPAPFNWRLGSGRGGSVAIEPRLDSETNRALHVEIDAVRADWLARQTLLLPPGVYRLSGEMSVGRGEAPEWIVRCHGGAPGLTTGMVHGAETNGWRPFQSDFIVRDACRAQLLSLEPSSIATPTEAWFDDLAIRRIGDADGPT